MSATEAIAAVEDLAVRAIQAEALLQKVSDTATTEDGRMWQVPADALDQIRAYLGSRTN